MAIYDLLGQTVRVLVCGRMEAGVHAVSWDGMGNDGRPLASGVYLCRMQADSHVAFSKLLLLK